MIRNERQYRTAVRQRRVLADARNDLAARNAKLLSLSDPSAADGPAYFMYQVEDAALEGEIAILDNQIVEYESLRSGHTSRVKVASFADLPEALVRARIAIGLTQRELAERIGVKEQQVQKYENERYAGASLSRLQETAAALGIELQADFDLPDADVPLQRLRKRLTSLGLSRRVVDARLLRGAPDALGPAKYLELAERAARMLAISVDQLMSGAALPALATTARFKAPKNAAQAPLDAYTRYAEGIADIVLRATQHLEPMTPPGSAQDVRSRVDELLRQQADAEQPLRSDDLFAATLDYLTELRIPVVALRDPGTFHGACFSQGSRSVIVLKQTSTFTAQWLNCLLHELDHVRSASREEPRTWIELGDVNQWSESPEEQRANDFAADVLFSGRTESVLSICLHKAKGSVERLKAVVPVVAAQAEVPTDVLAGQLAFRLSGRGINWWPTAITLHEQGMPWQYVNDKLLQQLDLRLVDAVDRAALLDALAG